jgi:hypothetical protein
MIDRLNYLTVALTNDTRADDAQAIIDAIAMVRGVLSVTPHVVDGSDWTAEQRARLILRDKLGKLLAEI